MSTVARRRQYYVYGVGNAVVVLRSFDKPKALISKLTIPKLTNVRYSDHNGAELQQVTYIGGKVVAIIPAKVFRHSIGIAVTEKCKLVSGQYRDALIALIDKYRGEFDNEL